MYVIEAPSRYFREHVATPLAGLGVLGDHDPLKAIREALPKCRASLGKLPKAVCAGKRTGPDGTRQVRFYFFPGTSTERALVIAGVHGSELAGIEVAENLVKRLYEEAKRGVKPYFNVVVVPELFPDNAARARGASNTPGEDHGTGRYTARSRCAKRRCGKKTVCTDPNRQFPKPGHPFETARPVNSLGGKIEPENQILLTLIQEFRPSRIASVHAHSLKAEKKIASGVGAPGIYYDKHTACDGADESAVTGATQRSEQDRRLALKMARRFEAAYNDLTKTTDGASRVPGNRLNTPFTTTLYGSARPRCKPKGTSLGEWGPHQVCGSIPGRDGSIPYLVRDSITVITVEVRHYYPSSKRLKPVDGETRQGVTNRPHEMAAHVEALRGIFLEKSTAQVKTTPGAPVRIWSIVGKGPAPPTERPTPTPGHLYQIRRGDTLSSIAGRAFGVGPGPTRLAFARLINDASFNRRFWRSPPPAEKKWFPRGRISFSPRFTRPGEQNLPGKSAPPGSHFARILIPRRPVMA